MAPKRARRVPIRALGQPLRIGSGNWNGARKVGPGLMATPHPRLQLGEQARAIMARGFAEDWTAKRIAQAIQDETRESVSWRTVARRAAERRVDIERRKLARERMEDLVAAAQKGGLEVSEFVRALALEALENNPDALNSADPVKVHGLALNSEAMRLKRRALDLRERQVAVSEGRLRLIEDRERRAIAVISGEKHQLSAAEILEEVKGIYGIVDHKPEQLKAGG